MAASVPARAEILSLFRSLLGTSKKFSDYNIGSMPREEQQPLRSYFFKESLNLKQLKENPLFTLYMLPNQDCAVCSWEP
ncbi:hypothetical protein MKW94_027166 [Papaver nudicaule]|uniref:Uncharacterized protein n=1 Tax=Papaver nudicaule TaxID=74823 RepID=A0AA41VNH6_PAPNU|nr:hypothetical protein [Papaver nudicaule]